ncbi:very short patch repair endonuclease [Marinilongibacter aquaticus]|uniref:very short patch repair endonuclease n=1 Tax=Marinilongibacter aquaticus TaxID=2975157 RepID=UPI0021BD88B8|nr:very short patch repair endonuclease [Marinilongibacter aquaticus]UBM60637.1 very short patch repair endonuclease [Marinilongibacter aquaticus]
MAKRYDVDVNKTPRFEEKSGFYTSRTRSRMMSKIRSKNTKPEILFRRVLHAQGLRFRVHVKDLPGKPDIANKAKKYVVFIDGDFWHGHDWNEKKKQIKSNRAFWIAKIDRNIARDRQVNADLENRGFKVFRFWASDIKRNLGRCVKEVLNYLAEPV